MSRLMSVAFTEDAVRERRKTVTRRKGWWEDSRGRRILKPGDRLTLCRKVMGRTHKDADGYWTTDPLVKVAEVEVVSVRRETLDMLCISQMESGLYGVHEVAREGFPGMEPAEFIVRFFIEAQDMWWTDEVTRIEFRYLDEEEYR